MAEHFVNNIKQTLTAALCVYRKSHLLDWKEWRLKTSCKISWFKSVENLADLSNQWPSSLRSIPGCLNSRLRQNWLDTREAFAELDEATLQTLGMPLALQKKLLEKAQALKGTKSGANPESSQTSNKIVPENAGPTGLPTTKELAKTVNELLDLVYKEVLGRQNFINTLQMMHALIGNVAGNPTEAKFKVIKLDKPAIIETIGKSPSSLKIFRFLGFVDSPRGYLEIPEKVAPRVADMQETLKVIEAFGNKIGKLLNLISATLNSQLGVASITSTTGRSNADIAKINNSSLSNDYDFLIKLKADREVRFSLIQALVKDTVPRQTRFITQEDIDRERAEAIERNRGFFAQELTQEEEAAGEDDDVKSFTAHQRKQIMAVK